MGKEAYKDIWVFAEQEGGVLSGTTFELLAKAHDLKKKLGGTDTVVAVLLGSGVEGLIPRAREPRSLQRQALREGPGPAVREAQTLDLPVCGLRAGA